MRFLIVAAIFACAVAAPGLPVGQRIEPTLPTISAGDINGAAIDAQVEVADHVRAAIDVDRQFNDKVSELHGQAINNAEEQAWRTVDAVKTIEAKLDGAAAAAAPIIAKNLVRGVATSGVTYGNPAAYGTAPVAPIVQPAAPGPVVQATAPVASVVAAPASYATGPVTPFVQPAAPVAPFVQSAAPVGPFVQSAAPVDPFVQPAAQFVQQSAPVAYPVAPLEYAAPAYNGFSDPIFDNSAYFNGGFDQGIYGAPLNYANVW